MCTEDLQAGWLALGKMQIPHISKCIMKLWFFLNGSEFFIETTPVMVAFCGRYQSLAYFELLCVYVPVDLSVST